MNLPKITEKAFMAQVIQLAKLLGWTVYHTHDSRHSAAGFPDLVLRRGPGYAVRIIVAELKIGKKVPTTEQYAWLGAFEASSVQVYFWRPEDWEMIERILKGELT